MRDRRWWRWRWWRRWWYFSLSYWFVATFENLHNLNEIVVTCRSSSRGQRFRSMPAYGFLVSRNT